MSNAEAVPDEVLRLAKKALREQVIAQRDSLDTMLRSRCSQGITGKLLALPEFRAAGVVSAYASFGSEFDTSEFLCAALQAGKRLLLPRVNRAAHALELREAKDLAVDLVAGVWGIREPLERCPIVPARKVDFILVPGIAFTVRGERLGYGGGFYDRLLAGLSPEVPRVAGAFALQVVESIPTGLNDQRVHMIVTENRPAEGRREER